MLKVTLSFKKGKLVSSGPDMLGHEIQAIGRWRLVSMQEWRLC